MKHESFLACLIGLPASLVATTCLSQPREIGNAETVVPAVDSATAGTVSQLEPGSVIFQDDTIRTYKIGAAGLRFLDQTTLTVYPNSSITLDRFVYNPDKTVSEVAFSLLQGAFRLASGGLRTSEKYKLQTPHVIFGIRGTVIHVSSDENSSIVQALHGAFSGCSRISDICRLVKATDAHNGAQFWNDGRVDLGRFSPNLGVRQASGGGSLSPAERLQKVRVRRIESAQPGVPAPPETQVPIGGLQSAVLPDIPSISIGAGSSRNPVGAICFVRGTLILTPDGVKRIEDLQPGDQVVTKSSGLQRIKWIPRQVFRREHGRAWGSEIAPIAIEKDALGEGFPNRRLILSPAHSLFLENILIPARLLVNGTSIRRVDYSGTVLEYFNIELEQHQIIYANGAAVETFYPPDERAREHWSNFWEFSRKHPGEERRTFSRIAPVLHGGRRRILQAQVRNILCAVVDRRETLELVRSRIAMQSRLRQVGTQPGKQLR
ncbi:Hint domain-containing protein [Microvirga roseola]|uniref:Hint domain-containing protein n=1 Tax=Microvirga roseola TaxID=2883126 RepID=UPI001E5ACC63|nr:Hint domain-containing protein [Microvirga roseola]